MLKSYELFGFMSPGLANEILTFAFETEKPTYRAVLQAVAEARKLRPGQRQGRGVSPVGQASNPAGGGASPRLLRGRPWRGSCNFVIRHGS